MKKLAKCKKTYADEDDMVSYAEGNIKKSDVKIYIKGRDYLVYPEYFNEDYWELKSNQ